MGKHVTIRNSRLISIYNDASYKWDGWKTRPETPMHFREYKNIRRNDWKRQWLLDLFDNSLGQVSVQVML